MKQTIFTKFRWLTPKAIKKNFDPKELIAFILPTTGFYYDIIPKLINLQKTVFLVSVVIIFLLLFLINLYKRNMDYEKSIAEVLETGYFLNFLDKTAIYIQEKKQTNQFIKFNFKDGTNETVKADQIKVKLILPLSLSGLNETIKSINSITKSGNIDNGPWVYAKKNSDNTITIYDCPRTLTALSKYLINSESSYSDDLSRTFHKLFNAKFDQDWDNAGESIPKDIFMKSNEFEESVRLNAVSN